MKKEIEKKPTTGLLSVLIIAIAIAGIALSIANEFVPTIIASIFLLVFTLPSFLVVNPNESIVLTFFGKYVGTVRENGFFSINPLVKKKRISLRARNFDSERVKVNDKLGNPIMISVIAVWRVRETYKAAFEVDNYQNFVKVQSDAAVRKLAGLYPYDNFDDEQSEMTLRSGMADVNEKLEQELQERLDIAGIEVLEARIGYLAYAEEIASAMLKRQQATAVVAARFKIVEGAVGMVEHALADLKDKNIIELDPERKAAMVSNLLVVLCSDKETTPVVNTGSLYN